MHNLVLKRIICQRDHDCLEGLYELASKSRPIAGMPIGRFGQFQTHGWTKDDSTAHLRRDQSHSRTSS